MKRFSRLASFLLFSLLAVLAAPSPGLAQTKPPELTALSMADLMNIEITSASRKEQRAGDVAAAVYVITHDEIRRSGMTSIPDLLRLAPGVDVAQINSNKWAVTVRGFNGLYANKLLVLVDGRTVYDRNFAGVLWDAEDLMLDDIDRIEVIRGPGAALWGANAVNGVINIITKPAADTQGALVRVEGGRAGEQAAFRYGGTRGTASYRLYSQWSRRDESLLAPDVRANDASHSTTSGFRLDRPASSGALALAGSFTAGQQRALWPNFDPKTAALEPIANQPSDSLGGNLLGRWTHTGARGASTQVQSFLSVENRREPVAADTRVTFDLDTQSHRALGAHHDLVAGAGYRFISDAYTGHVGVSQTPADDKSSLLTAFVQDEIALLGKRLAVTLGSQVQYDSASGAGVQPTARVMWKASPQQRLWAATSRALRTPANYERGTRVDYPPVPTESGLPLVVTFQGNPTQEAENLVDAEAGYRLELGDAASIDVTAYTGRYDHLQSTEVLPPVVEFVPSPRILVTTTFANLLSGTTRGLEVAGHWTPAPALRLDGSYTAFHLTPHLAPESQDPTSAQADANAPRTQWQLRSSLAPGARVTLNVAIIRAGPLEQLKVDGYTRADINAEWRLTTGLSIMVIGQNLFDAAHAEFGGTGSVLLPTQVARSASARLRWTFGR